MSVPVPNSKAQLLAKMEGTAKGIAQLYFIDLSLRDALTSGSVKEFGSTFVEKMAWTSVDGITIQAGTVQCAPILHKDVLDAEVQMLASTGARPGRNRPHSGTHRQDHHAGCAAGVVGGITLS